MNMKTLRQALLGALVATSTSLAAAFPLPSAHAAANGRMYLLSYNRDWHVAIDRFNPGGAGTTSVFTSTSTASWSTIEPFAMDGQTYIISYDWFGGKVAIDRVSSGGSGYTSVYSDTWSNGWSIIEPFTLDGAPIGPPSSPSPLTARSISSLTRCTPGT